MTPPSGHRRCCQSAAAFAQAGLRERVPQPPCLRLLRAAGALHDTIGLSAESQVPKQLRLNAPLVTADLPRRQWGHSGSPFAPWSIIGAVVRFSNQDLYEQW